MGRRRRVLILTLAALALTGCGNARTAAPSLTTPAGARLRTVTLPAFGIRIAAPSNWSGRPGRLPLIASFVSGPAVIALWRFPRHVPVPSDPGALHALLRRLIAEARRRDPTFSPIRAALSRLDGAPALELDAFEHIDGLLRRVRSMHVFVRSGELVLDEYAPPALFHAVDHAVFSPVRRSLALLPGTA